MIFFLEKKWHVLLHHHHHHHHCHQHPSPPKIDIDELHKKTFEIICNESFKLAKELINKGDFEKK